MSSRERFQEQLYRGLLPIIGALLVDGKHRYVPRYFSAFFGCLMFYTFYILAGKITVKSFALFLNPEVGYDLIWDPLMALIVIICFFCALIVATIKKGTLPLHFYVGVSLPAFAANLG